jgi:hypothetical protein
VAATALATTSGVFDGVALMVAEADVVGLNVTVNVFVMVAVLVNVDVGVNVGDGVNVLVGGTNWVGVLGRVTVGPPGVTVGAGVVGGWVGEAEAASLATMS